MSKRTTPAADPDRVGETPIEDLIARAGDLKGELVAFPRAAGSPGS